MTATPAAVVLQKEYPEALTRLYDAIEQSGTVGTRQTFPINEDRPRRQS
jgi:hypothetical protein